MPLIEDTNNKPGQHTTKNEYWKSEGERVLRCKLPYGDYIRPPKVVVDTKRDICELAMDIRNDHTRFRNAAVKARDMGSVMWILVENDEGVRNLADLAQWVEPVEHFRMRKRKNDKAEQFIGETLAKACATMQRKYGLMFDFCTTSEAGARVIEILDGGGNAWERLGNRPSTTTKN